MASFMILFLFVVSLLRTATSLCPLLGPDFPPPRNVSQSAAFRKAVNSFSNTIHQLLSTNSSSLIPFDPTNNTFSINIFSKFSDTPLYEYHYTAPLFANGSIGTKKVDGDTVYRIGSISKLLTVFAFLVEKGDANFNDPITKYVPELRDSRLVKQRGVVNAVQWNDVTLGALASQMSGIGRDYSGDLSRSGLPLVEAGFPPLNASDVPPCDIGIPGVPTCDRAAFFKGFLDRHPVFAPSTTPIYSNVAFQILAYALENMTNNKSFGSILSKKILKPLHMDGTSVSQPKNSSVGAIPGNTPSSGWDTDWGDETPAGGIYSTSNDLAKLGRAIFSNTLLCPAQTRRWMKPVTHTSSLTSSVGAPWEIFRVPTSRGIVDLYTKAGDVGVYSSLLVLAPDYDIGWVILSAADNLRTAAIGALVFADLIADTFIPAFEAAAKDSAAVAFSGTYKATNGLNSSITIVTDKYPGLGIHRWISNGTDILAAYLAFNELADRFNASVRLYPTNLFQDSPKEQAFRAVFEVLPKNATATGSGAGAGAGSVFSSNCFTWVGVDGISYGNVAADDFLFHFDKYGNVVSMEQRMLRVILKKGF